MRRKKPRVSDTDLPPTPYTLRDMIIRLTECIESHTKADDEWRDTVMELFSRRLREKDDIIEMLREDKKWEWRRTSRMYRLTAISILGVLMLGGVKIAELVGLIGL